MANEYFFGLFKRQTTDEKPLFDRKPTIKSKPSKPEPVLAEKPDDITEFCFAFVCPDKHINRPDIDKIGPNDTDVSKVCQECGKLTKLATIKKISEATWNVYFDNYSEKYRTYWSHNGPYRVYNGFVQRDVIWTKREFVNFVNKPSRKKK